MLWCSSSVSLTGWAWVVVGGRTHQTWQGRSSSQCQCPWLGQEVITLLSRLGFKKTYECSCFPGLFLPLKLSAPSSEDSAKHKPCRKSTCCCLPRHAGSGHACLLVPASVLQGASSELVASSTGSLQSVSCQKPNPPLPPVARLVNLHAVGPDKLWDIEWRPFDVTACLLLCPVVITTNDSRCCQIPAGEQDCPVGSAALEILLYFTSLLQSWGWRLDSFLHLRHDEAVQSLGIFIWPCWMASRAHGPTGLLRLGAASPPLAGSWAWSLKTGLAKELSKVQTSQLNEEACPGISEAQIRTHRTKAGIGCYQTQWGRGAKVGLPDTFLQRGVLATLRVDLIQTGSSDEGPGHK